MSDIFTIKEIKYVDGNDNREKIGIDLTIDVNDISITLPIDTSRMRYDELKEIIKIYDE